MTEALGKGSQWYSLNSNGNARDIIVSGIACTSVVAIINVELGGGSSRIFKND